jgi:cyclophilin family peptidyl-prolyl cis-trans isomerase
VLLTLGVVGALMVYAAAEEDNPQVAGGASKTPSAGLPCPRVEAPATSSRQYDEAPELTLAPNVNYSAVIATSCGDIKLDLLENKAPRNVANFVFLARQGFFDGLTWHRIERNFVIQTGDPDGINGHEPDGPGYTIPDELPAQDRDYVYGAVAMANEGPNTGGSQFFIVVHDPSEKKEPAGLESLYSIFGRVSKTSYGTLDKIASMPVKGGDDAIIASQPQVPVYVDSIQILRSEAR